MNDTQTDFVRYDRTTEELSALYDTPLLELIGRALRVHTRFHPPGEVQMCRLISIKTGGCSEDCKYCSQSSRYKTAVKAQPMMKYEEVIRIAKEAVRQGATRVCLGAAWRGARDSRQFDETLRMVKGIAELGVEVCCTLGLLTDEQARKLKEADLYAYNHNLDSSERFYKTIITTRSYRDRLNTLDAVRKVGISVCCGGIIGMGETKEDRMELLRTLASRNPHPESVPINLLVPIPGTPLGDRPPLPFWELVRMVAVARIAMPASMVRLSAGRITLSYQEQALCFLAGANSIFVGDKLLTAENAPVDRDEEMFSLLGLRGRPPYAEQHVGRNVTPDGCERGRSLLPVKLSERERSDTIRSLTQDKDLIDFASNDYLGLARSPLFKEKSLDAWRSLNRFVGSGGSRLLTGNDSYTEELEECIASFHGFESATLFNSGYMANIGLVQALSAGKGLLLYDEHIHASIRAGIRIGRASSLPFRHNGLDHLEKRLKKGKGRGDTYVFVESIYSTDGSRAPLLPLFRLTERYGAKLIVDEAHAVGVFGREGRGLVDEEGLAGKVFAQTVTFGKALGALGAAITGNALLKKVLINFAHSFIYTTAPPFPLLATIRCAYELFPRMDREREHVKRLGRIAGAPFALIRAVPVSGNRAARALVERATRCGFNVKALLSPTVRRGKEILRLTFHAFNKEEDVVRLLEVMENRG
ncbi:MAG: biotin synthase BioB [Simkaniaceae bacterium]|nr:biotin synthase BioB [Simkaniaceae bacterium]